MSMPAVATRHVFGIKSTARQNLAYVDEQTVAYPVGRLLALYHTDTKTQKFLPGSEKCKSISAVCTSPNGGLVAIAEQTEDRAAITVLDVRQQKKKKTLINAEFSCDEYISLCFSADGKFILAQGGAPDWGLALWLWEKGKIVCSTKISAPQNTRMYECAFAPGSVSTGNIRVSVIGENVIRLFSVQEGVFKPLPLSWGKREFQNYLCHAWLSDEQVVLGTDAGDILLMENGDFKTILPDSPADGNSIDSIVPFSKGFVCGCDGGAVHIFDRIDDKVVTYRQSKVFKIENNRCRIRTLALSPSEDSLLCGLENSQVYLLALSNADILKPEDMNFDFLSHAFHSKQITGMDTCVRRPLAATCGLDLTVRIWNYVDRNVEIIKAFNEECYSLAFHPSGHYLLVGFSDKLRMMNVLMDDLRSFKELPIKSCRECVFSHGGHYFAAVNGNTICLFSTYTCENVGNLRGHNGKVRSLCWSRDDTRLVSAGMDGAVYEWKIKNFKRKSENVIKSCSYTSVQCTPDGKFFFAAGSDGRLKEISDEKVTKSIDAGVVLTQLVLSHSGRMLFAGTETGSIRAYAFPLTGEYHEYVAHDRPVTRLRMSHDDTVLFSVGEDGCVFVHDIRDKDARPLRRDGRLDLLPWAEEILVTKSDLEDKTALMADLKRQNEDLTLQNEYQLRLKEMNHNEKVKEVTEKFTQEIEQERDNCQKLLQEKNEMEMTYDERLKIQEQKHREAVEQIEAQYQQKIISEVERYQALTEEKERMGKQWEEQHALSAENHNKLVQELTEDYEYKLQEEQLLLERAREEKDDIVREFEEMKRQLEQDTDRELEDIKERYEGKLGSEKDANLRLKGENGIMRKKFESLRKEIEDKQEQIQQQYELNKKLHQTIENFEKDIIGLKKEIRERDETIRDKEKRIYDLKKKNQELEKFKFVLDYKIKELKKQIEPREEEINAMKTQIQEMVNELERYHKQNSQLELSINDRDLRLDGLQREVLDLRKRTGDANLAAENIRNDLYDVAQHIQDPKALKDGVKRIYEKHVHNRVVKESVGEDIHREYKQQREHLEKSVLALKKKLAKETQLYRSDNARILQENVTLINEINDLRREIKSLKQSQQAADAAGRGNTSAKEIQMQRQEIRRLRERLEEQDREIARLRAGQVEKRPTSREVLPPMEGFGNQPTAN